MAPEPESELEPGRPFDCVHVALDMIEWDDGLASFLGFPCELSFTPNGVSLERLSLGG